MATTDMIRFENVKKIYTGLDAKSKDIVALHNVNLSIKKGEFVFVLGHSGAGKSTFLKLILREEAATEGKVFVNGRDLSSIRQREIPYLRRGLGVVFQDFRLIPTMTAYENVAFAMRVTNIPERQIKRRVPYVLNLVGLAGKAHSLPQELSGGEQQRIRWRGLWCIPRPSSLRTSPPAISTRSCLWRSWSCCRPSTAWAPRSWSSPMNASWPRGSASAPS